MKSVKEKILDVKKENFDDLLYLMEADTFAHNLDAVKGRIQAMKEIRNIYEMIKEENHPLDISDLKIDGKVLMGMGYAGKEIGEKLDEALKLVIENPEKNTEKFLTERFLKR